MNWRRKRKIHETKLKREAIYTKESVNELITTEWDFASSDTQQHLHSLHPYPARMIPQIVEKALLQWTKKGDTVLDPFVGCGTTLLEAIILGRNAIGIDNNSVACLISKTKAVHYSNSDIKDAVDFYDTFYQRVTNDMLKEDIPHYANIDYWFDDNAKKELGRIKACIR